MKKLSAYAINIFILVFSYLWVIEDVEWAENIFKFLVWFFTIITILVAFIDDAKEEAKTKGRSISVYSSIAFDVVLIIFMVGWGSVFYGCLILIQALFQSYIYDSDANNKLT